MTGYRYLSPAERELHEAALFYDAAAEGLGTDFLEDVQRAIDRIRRNPNSGKALTDTLYRLLLSRFPFSIIYAQEDNAVLIVAVAHHRRRPGYWQSRLTE